MADRSDELRVLSALLGAPAEDAREAVADLARQFPWLECAAAELRSLSLEEWQGEHTRLFVNGFPSTPCPPFESAYRDGHLFGARVGEIEDLYGRLGLESSGAPADFLGTLLECAAWLEAEPGGWHALRQELWHGHLGHWLPRFCADLERHSRIHLYRVLASRLRALLPAPVTPEPGTA